MTVPSLRARSKARLTARDRVPFYRFRNARDAVRCDREERGGLVTDSRDERLRAQERDGSNGPDHYGCSGRPGTGGDATGA